MPATPDLLTGLLDSQKKYLDELTGAHLCIGFSGGRDSGALLHALSELGDQAVFSRIRALHVNHQLMQESAAWAEHCAEFCDQYGIHFTRIDVDVKDIGSLGLEAAARKARLQVYQQHLTPNERLVLAHHGQDQAETVLLQLFRGAGVRGLAAMNSWSLISGLEIWRPLLDVSREAIDGYASEHGIRFIDDPSNKDKNIRRVYLREAILPVVRETWPSVDDLLRRSADHCRSEASLLDGYLMSDLEKRRVPDRSACLDVRGLDGNPPLASALIRLWLKELGLQSPTYRRMSEIVSCLIPASARNIPEVSLGEYVLRLYRKRLYLCWPAKGVSGIFNPVCIRSASSVLDLPDKRQIFFRATELGGGIEPDLLASGELYVDFRRQDDSLLKQKQGGAQKLKKYFQMLGIPPWERQDIPLIFHGQELVGLVGYQVCKGYTAPSGRVSYIPCLSEAGAQQT